ncbi:MAG: hypothetical protein LC775_13740, partial [Acidobacteria bacterium]|nr:hypothetical protein [Acidobacteriota bacterium]
TQKRSRCRQRGHPVWRSQLPAGYDGVPESEVIPEIRICGGKAFGLRPGSSHSVTSSPARRRFIVASRSNEVFGEFFDEPLKIGGSFLGACLARPAYMSKNASRPSSAGSVNLAWAEGQRAG